MTWIKRYLFGSDHIKLRAKDCKGSGGRIWLSRYYQTEAYLLVQTCPGRERRTMDEWRGCMWTTLHNEGNCGGTIRGASARTILVDHGNFVGVSIREDWIDIETNESQAFYQIEKEKNFEHCNLLITLYWYVLFASYVNLLFSILDCCF